MSIRRIGDSVAGYAWALGAILQGLTVSLGAQTSPAGIYEVRGLTEPVGDVVLSTVTTGIIARIHYSEGDFVREGATILELNSMAEELELERRRVQLKTLREELERSELLFKASASLPLEELARKRAEVEISEVEAAQAEEILDRRRVVSSISGIITNIPVKVGEYCEVGRAVARVVDSREFYVTSNVDPERAGHLRPGRRVEVAVPAPGGSVTIDGEVIYVAPVIDPASGLLRVRALFSNTSEQVRPGVAGLLRIPPADGPGH